MSGGPPRIEDTRMPPHHPEAERLVLGAVLRDPAIMEFITADLTPEDFYRGAHRKIWEAMQRLYAFGEPIDLVTVSERIGYERLDEVGGMDYLSELVDQAPAGIQPRHYAAIVKEKALRRRLIHVASEAAASSYSTDNEVMEVIATAEKELLTLTRNDGREGWRELAPLLIEQIEEIERLYKSNSPVSGFATGFHDLDEITNGLKPTELVIVAGRPGMGKTAFTLNLATNLAHLNKAAVLVFSLEMGADQLVRRMLTSRARVDGGKLQKGILDKGSWERIYTAADELSSLRIVIDDDASLSIPMILTKARRLSAQLTRGENPVPLGLIVVDYLQLMAGHGKSERREQEISAISRGLKLLARELKVPVVALSQLNRSVESRPDKRPMMSDLRESGAIEQDADLVIFLYRDKVYNPETPDPTICELLIRKHRNGPTGDIKLYFNEQYTVFDNLARGRHVPDQDGPSGDADFL
jgi:replicative DNA helicase